MSVSDCDICAEEMLDMYYVIAPRPSDVHDIVVLCIVCEQCAGEPITHEEMVSLLCDRKVATVKLAMIEGYMDSEESTANGHLWFY